MLKSYTLAKQALQDPVSRPVAPADLALDAHQEPDRIAGESANDESQRFAAEDWERLVIINKNAMPNCIRSKLVKQPPTATIRKLYVIAFEMTVFNPLCPKNYLSRDCLNAVTAGLTENFVNASTKLSIQGTKADRLNEYLTKGT